MECLVPWARLEAAIAPSYPRSGRVGRPPIGVPKMLRMYCLQQWYGLADEALEDALYDSQAMRDFVGIDLSRESRLAGMLDRRDDQAQTGSEVATIAGPSGEGEVEPPSALEVDPVEEGAQKREVVAAELATAFAQQAGLRATRAATAPRRHAGVGGELATGRRCL